MQPTNPEESGAEEVRLARNRKRKEYRKRRRAAKRRVEERERPGCPHPEKPAYDRNDPIEARLQDRRMPYGGSSYDCRCGFSHNTSQPGR